MLAADARMAYMNPHAQLMISLKSEFLHWLSQDSSKQIICFYTIRLRIFIHHFLKAHFQVLKQFPKVVTFISTKRPSESTLGQ